MSESTELTAVQARQVVLQIARKKGWISQRARENSDAETLEALESLREELGDAVETIAQDIYSRKARFVLELIQNAEDNKFTRAKSLMKDPYIAFEVQPTKIIVECNEDGFTETNVISICRTGQSSKKYHRGYIGEKGIGFKSVFQVASKVHIQSNSFSFSFQYGEGDHKEKIGIITPIPEDKLIPLGERPLTRMTLTPMQDLLYDDLLAQFNDIHKTLLLFLSTIKVLKIKTSDSDQKITVTTFQKSESSTARIVNLIETVEYPDEPEKKSIKSTPYYIAKKPIFKLPVDKARVGIDECEVVLAFPLHQNFSPLISKQYVSAFLPIREVDLSFLIQADFILQANRQDIVDSARNKAILTGVATVFRDAVLQFCRSESILRYQWMRFLPSVQSLDTLWEALPSDINSLLNLEAILYSHGSLDLHRPEELRTLPDYYLDKDGSPLFEDCPGVHRKYLSLQYASNDIMILKEEFHLRDIEDVHIYSRIKQDLSSHNSKMTASDTDEDWHTRAANLISSILLRSPVVGSMIKGLALILLIDGEWTDSSAKELYFPSESGPEIPRDLIITVDPKATKNISRKKMFMQLGVTHCPPRIVIERMWKFYLKDGGASKLSSSMAHISYMYWHHEKTDDPRFSLLWLYDKSERKVTSRLKLIYFESKDEYGPQELLKAVQDPKNRRRYVRECEVPYLNSAYMRLFPPSTRRHEVSWLSWLENTLGVRRVPRLKSDGGSLSPEFRHIIQYRPEKIIGTLKEHWAVYESEMSPVIVETLSQAEVACDDRLPEVLKNTYLPLQGLKEKAQALGLSRSFPFLKMPNSSEDKQLLRDWRFLEEFEVGFEADLAFYVEVLRQHEARSHQSWGSKIQDSILKTYESVSDHCSEKDKDWLWEQLDQNSLILDPSSFQTNASAPCWIDIESCVWNGPENLLDKKPLASVPQYRDNKTLARFFRQILDIEDANWNDYLKMLLDLKNKFNPSHNISDKVSRLYHLLSEVAISEENWEKIVDCFESECLVYIPSNSQWFSPSECLWTCPVPIDGKAVIGNSYTGELKTFFLKRLKISPASLGTLVEELCSLAQRNPTVSMVKEMIWAINAMAPTPGDMVTLLTSDILPVRVPLPNSNHTISLQSCQSDFVVIDRTNLADIFDGHAEFLDFTLEEVQQLEPFITSLDLGKKYLSSVCDEKTACDESGFVDSKLTSKFHERAYGLLRCAVSQRSIIAMKNPQSIYDRLLTTSIIKTDGISTQYTLHKASGTQIIHVPRGYVHVQERDTRWEIFVPQNRKDRELCYFRQLPEALTKRFGVTLSAREIIGNVLNSHLFVIDDLLEAAGIGKVPNIEFPHQPPLEDSSEEDITETEEANSSRNLRAQTAPILTTLNTFSQVNFSDLSSLNDGRSSSLIDQAILPYSSTFRNNNRAGTSSAADSDNQSTPASSGSRNLTPQPSQDTANSSSRNFSPAYFNPSDSSSNNAYRELLDNVIRIANRTTLPHRDLMIGPDEIRSHQTFDHEATFGIRSQGQMSHDTKIGAAGELFVFEMLSNLLLPSFGQHNWKSTIRKEVTIHPKYIDMEPWIGAETADITYKDFRSTFTSLLIREGYLEENIWRGASPQYFIEVKSTTGECNDRFFLSNRQYLRMQRMALIPGQIAAEIYIIFRVFNLSRNSLNVKIYVDPESYRRRGDLVFEVQSWTVKSRA